MLKEHSVGCVPDADRDAADLEEKASRNEHGCSLQVVGSPAPKPAFLGLVTGSGKRGLAGVVILACALLICASVVPGLGSASNASAASKAGVLGQVGDVGVEDQENLKKRLVGLRGELPLPPPVVETDRVALIEYRESDSDIGVLLQLASIGASALNSSNDRELFRYLRSRIQVWNTDNPNIYRLAAWYVIKSNGDSQRRAAIARYIMEEADALPRISEHIDEGLQRAIEDNERFRWSLWNHVELELFIQVMLWHRKGYSQSRALDELEKIREAFRPTRGDYDLAVELVLDVIEEHFPDSDLNRGES